jgi:hypothetical protein
MPRELSSRFAGRIRWIGFQNQSGQSIPPYSIIEASGWQMPDPSGSNVSVSSPVVLAGQPSDPINPYACYITGAATVPAGGNGVCAQPTLDLPLLVSLSGSQQSGSDAPFRMCGASNGSWTATRDMPGLAMVDRPQQGYALVIPTRGPYLAQLGTGSSGTPINPQQQTSQSSTQASGPAAGTWQTITVTTAFGLNRGTGGYGDAPPIGSETLTGATLSIYNRFNPILPGGVLLFDWTGQGWEVVESPNGGGFCRGFLTSNLTQGGSATVQIATTSDTNTITITVNEVLGTNGATIASGTKVTAFYNLYTNQYEVVSTGCTAASS